MNTSVMRSFQERYQHFDATAPDSALRERWKYTKLQPFAAILDSSEGQDNALQLKMGADSQSVKPAPFDPSDIGEHAVPEVFGSSEDWSNYPLAGGLFSRAQGWLLELPKAAPISADLELRDGQGYGVITLPAASEASLRLNLTGQQQSLGALLLDVGRDSSLALDTTALGTQGLCWLLTKVRLAQNATLTVRQYYVGGGNHRFETHVVMAEPGAQAQLVGASVAAPKSRLDQQITLEHQAANATSHQQYHCAGLADSRSNFNGRIHIHRHASQTLAELSNRNLALTDNAQLNTKPELEIYNDDVRCAHGATVGALDQQALYYCQSRGIPQAQARSLLTTGFLRQCVAGPAEEPVMQAIKGLIT